MNEQNILPHRFQPGTSGNPDGRPAGFAKRIKGEVGADGAELVAFALAVFRDAKRPHRERWEALCWLSDHGWGRPPQGVAVTMVDGTDDSPDRRFTITAVDYRESIRPLSPAQQVAQAHQAGQDYTDYREAAAPILTDPETPPAQEPAPPAPAAPQEPVAALPPPAPTPAPPPAPPPPPAPAQLPPGTFLFPSRPPSGPFVMPEKVTVVEVDGDALAPRFY